MAYCMFFLIVIFLSLFFLKKFYKCLIELVKSQWCFIKEFFTFEQIIHVNLFGRCHIVTKTCFYLSIQNYDFYTCRQRLISYFFKFVKKSLNTLWYCNCYWHTIIF